MYFKYAFQLLVFQLGLLYITGNGIVDDVSCVIDRLLHCTQTWSLTYYYISIHSDSGVHYDTHVNASHLVIHSFSHWW